MSDRFDEAWLRDHKARMGRMREGARPAPRFIDRDVQTDPRAKADVEAEAAGRVPRPRFDQAAGTAEAELASREPGLRKSGGERPLIEQKARPCALGGDVTGGERPAPKRKMKRPEQDLHKAAYAFLCWALPPNWRAVHVPNGGWRRRIEAAILKAMGVRPGFPDLPLIGPAQRLVMLEFKAEKNGRLTAEQEEWRDWFVRNGIPWFLCRSIDDVVAACEDAGVPLLGRPQ